MDLRYLETTLKNLRQAWPHQWPGLDVVVRSSLKKMGHTEAIKLSPRTQAVHDCIFSVAAAIEKDGQRRAALAREPAYHNRLHFADTVVSLCILLCTARKLAGRKTTEPLSHAEWLGMLAMVSHDFLHTGRINRFPSEIESLTVQALAPHMARSKIHKDDRSFINALILKTDPVFVSESHQHMAELTFDVANPHCMLVLLQESDILASALAETGESLTRHLAQEWASIAPLRSKALLKREGRLFFLKHVALFTSPASLQLGIQSVIDDQIARLQEA
jgi:hypothetical protein